MRHDGELGLVAPAAPAPGHLGASRRPQRRSWTTPLRATSCVEVVSLGNDAWSTTTTSCPQAGQQHGGGCPGDPCAHDDDVMTVLAGDTHRLVPR